MEDVEIKRLKEDTRTIEEIRMAALECLNNSGFINGLEKDDLTGAIFGCGAYLYLNPTEVSPMSNIVSKDDNVLTVLGSGDFMIDSSFSEASRVLGFDINDNQYFIAALKLKAMQHWDYENYYSFFSDPRSDRFLNYYDYCRLVKYMKSIEFKSFVFINEIINELKKDREDILEKLKSMNLSTNLDVLRIQLDMLGLGYFERLGYDDIGMILSYLDSNYEVPNSLKTLTGTEGFKSRNTYLESEDTYKKAKGKLKHTSFEFINCDIKRIKEELAKLDNTDELFDTIYLSNIPEFMSVEKIEELFDVELMPLLKDNGTIAYCNQATSLPTLMMDTEHLNDLKEYCRKKRSILDKYLMIKQLVNSVETFRLLVDKYQVDISSLPTACEANGFDLEDTYVYVKKK